MSALAIVANDVVWAAVGAGLASLHYGPRLHSARQLVKLLQRIERERLCLPPRRQPDAVAAMEQAGEAEAASA